MIKKSKGFTLIELLVVIAIIGILSSVVLASLNSSRAKANKAAFKKEAKALQSALVNTCYGATVVIGDFTDGDTWTKGGTLLTTATTSNPASPTTGGVAQSCGISGNATFSFNIQSDKVASCWAQMTESKLLFSSNCN